MTRVILCEEAIQLYMIWTALLEQKKPRAEKKEISEARRAYQKHRATCNNCEVKP